MALELRVVLDFSSRLHHQDRDAGFFSEDKAVYYTKLLLERAEQDGETIRRAAHRSRAQAWSWS